MDFVKQFLSDQSGPIIQQLTSQLGFSSEQAQSFLPPAVEKVVGALKGGGLDLGSLLGGGDPSALVSQVDAESLASEAGVDVGTASAGLQALVPTLLGSLKEQSGGAAGVLSLLGGDGGGLLDKAGKLGGLFK